MQRSLIAGLIAGLLASFYATSALADTPAISRLDFQLTDPANRGDADGTINALFGEINQVPAYTDLWSRVRAGFTIPDVDNALTEKWENYYAARPEYLNRIIARGSRYLYFVANEVERRGLPMELALLPMIESAYNPKAESPARAAGMWQFIPDTGKRYGLERTWWYDGRRDVVAATDAALDYLTTLNGMFNDWQLALASYNWGENAVARAVNKNQAAGLPIDFANLRMPDETRNYVPKLLAVRNIIANPQAYGIQLSSLPNSPYFATIQTGRHMDVKVAAELAEIPVDELLRLNPGFIRPVIAYKDERKLVLPADKVDTFQRNLAVFDKPLLNWQPYVTKPGESFDKMASTFGISAVELRDINDIAQRERSARGQTILVPMVAGLDLSERQTLVALAANKQADPLDTGAQDAPRAVNRAREHQVAKGDTVFNIAKRYGVSVATLREANGLRGNAIHAGQVLKVAAVEAPRGKAAAAAQAKAEHDFVVVKRGDTLASIAKRYKLTVADLKRINKLGNKAAVAPGVKLALN
ncbi:membrane-bound lytic murein transglycosylase D [Andreprevotia lacus DSM 23236]|jgi:membrane-bound lytic murein transglycosylase D|uniref:Membrane-bound lytic murein transglycosylase D n=1 Tax=Andreprevotia lacus DSM 23236 TaxID=1121001 RepID=A0A1W1XY04_9NEIS|nr:LysM peptidoglycan-binding domain-containing protein [Andreprevotia lacus]SMC28782.1 membrane-bound lytic murein transglycosylase D [Andreprevotia lacus DSM 23236]